MNCRNYYRTAHDANRSSYCHRCLAHRMHSTQTEIERVCTTFPFICTYKCSGSCSGPGPCACIAPKRKNTADKHHRRQYEVGASTNYYRSQSTFLSTSVQMVPFIRAKWIQELRCAAWGVSQSEYNKWTMWPFRYICIYEYERWVMELHSIRRLQINNRE